MLEQEGNLGVFHPISTFQRWRNNAREVNKPGIVYYYIKFLTFYYQTYPCTSIYLLLSTTLSGSKGYLNSYIPHWLLFSATVQKKLLFRSGVFVFIFLEYTFFCPHISTSFWNGACWTWSSWLKWFPFIHQPPYCLRPEALLETGFSEAFSFIPARSLL